MPNYLVYMIETYSLLVEANNEDEALKLGQSTDLQEYERESCDYEVWVAE